MDDLWKQMNDEDAGVVAKRKAIATSRVNLSGAKEKEKVAVEKKTAKAKPFHIPGITQSDNAAAQTSTNNKKVVDFATLPVSTELPQSLIQQLGRLLNSIDDNSDAKLRLTSLKAMKVELFEKCQYSVACYNSVLREACKPLFKRFEDESEKCREHACKLLILLLQHSTDFLPCLPYFIPALLKRLPSPISYDEEMKIFVFDIQAHDEYKRGKAVERQDKQVLSVFQCNLKENSEEIRLMYCECLLTVLSKACSPQGSAAMLHPYFHDIVLYLQAQLRDTYPELKVVACTCLELLAEHVDFNLGMKYFAVALVRSILPILRHRHAKVRIAALTCLRACIIVPDRDKMKGSGTEAIADLVGFKEENVLSVAAFYVPEVRFNYLAELVTDSNAQVKLKVVELLTPLLTVIGDRFDHQTKLVPYLLDLLMDECLEVSTAALNTLKFCGKQYEDEHINDILEKRQYGVDGDDGKFNFAKQPVFPFQERPRVGVRLYVRGNVKRFLNALINELTNWIAHTRLKSANLLKIVLYLCEEHLTVENHVLYASLVKAVHFARQDGDRELHKCLLEICEILGRFSLPESYMHFLLPRLKSDVDVLQYGSDMNMKIAILQVLSSLISGTKIKQIVEHFNEIVNVLTDEFVVDSDSVNLRLAALDCLLVILNNMVRDGGGKKVVESYFLATGRLTSLKNIVQKLFHCFVFNLSLYEGAEVICNDETRSLLRDRTSVALILLAALDSPSVPQISVAQEQAAYGSSVDSTSKPGIVKAKGCSLFLSGVSDLPFDYYLYPNYQVDLFRLFTTYLPSVVHRIIDDYSSPSDWDLKSVENQILKFVVRCPLLSLSFNSILSKSVSNSLEILNINLSSSSTENSAWKIKVVHEIISHASSFLAASHEKSKVEVAALGNMTIIDNSSGDLSVATERLSLEFFLEIVVELLQNFVLPVRNGNSLSLYTKLFGLKEFVEATYEIPPEEIIHVINWEGVVDNFVTMQAFSNLLSRIQPIELNKLYSLRLIILGLICESSNGQVPIGLFARDLFTNKFPSIVSAFLPILKQISLPSQLRNDLILRFCELLCIGNSMVCGTEYCVDYISKKDLSKFKDLSNPLVQCVATGARNILLCYQNGLLEDSQEVVRLASLRLFRYCVPLIRPDDGTVQVFGYAEIVKRIGHIAKNELNSSECNEDSLFLCELDSTMRSLVSLFPAIAKDIVRQQYDASEKSRAYSSFISGILDHAEFMIDSN